MAIHSAKKAQIVLLVAKKVTILTEYLDFLDVFLEDNTLILSKIIELNQHAIKLQEEQQSSYRSIYSLRLVNLKTLKTYIEINFANGFIWPLKSSAGTSILFIEKPNGSFRLYVDYRSLNNLTIKNEYPLSLIGKLLD